jgi:hypothetical protein
MIQSPYSNCGSLKSIVLFDTKQYSLESDDNFAYQKIRKKYANFIKSIHVHSEHVHFYIFFRINRNEYVADVIKDRHYPITYIPVNVKKGKETCSIPTRWAQDVLLIDANSTLVYDDKKIDMRLIDQIIRHIPLTSRVLNGHLAGGEIMMGYRNGQPYTITSNQNCTATSCPYPYPSDCILHTSNALMNKYKKLLFHVDNFVTIVGEAKLAGKSRELILHAKYINEIGGDIAELNNWTTEIGRKLEQSIPDAKAYPIYQIVVHSQNNVVLFGLNYCNCLVENYVQNGQRLIHIYFPDFRKEIKSYISKLNEQEEELNNIYDNLYALAVLINPDFIQKDRGDFLENATRLIDETQKDIEQKLIDLFKGSTDQINVHFIEGDFYNQSEKLGSLHCMSKVVQRYKNYSH